nr:HAD hydrolase-like protein [Solimonas sp. SE-A11]
MISGATIESICESHDAPRIGVFTTSPRCYAETLLGHYYPDVNWDVIVAFEDVQHTKPFADGINRARAELGIQDFRRVVVIGDSWKDIYSAYRAGCWAVLFRACWPPSRADWDGQRYKAVNQLPDAIADSPEELNTVLEWPHRHLPLLEKYSAFGGDPPPGSPSRTQPINHFNNHNEDRSFVPVLTLGRLFSDYQELAPRRNWHQLTAEIHAHKDADDFPPAWVAAVREAMKEILPGRLLFGRTRAVIAVIPAKPGRTPRMEIFLGQLQAYLNANPWSDRIDLTYAPQLLVYGNGALSHHGAHLGSKERFDNVRDNLQVATPDIALRRHVVVIDDVVTSGATMFYANEYLRQAGASDVSCLALAQAVSLG